MYKLTNATGIIRLSDSASIPADPNNSDYAQYLIWLSDGNTPEPADTPPGPTPDDLKAEVLDALEDRPTRLQLKLVIQLSELTAASMAASHGLTVQQAIAYAYSKNPTYRRAKDAEAACVAIDSGAI